MEQKKSILLVYYKLFKPGGVAKVLTNLANALSEQGYTVEIILLMNEREHFYPLNPNIKVHNIDTFSHWAWKICEFNVKHLRFIPKIKNFNAYIYHIGVFLMLRNWMRKNHQNYDTIISAWYKLSKILSFFKFTRDKVYAWEHISHTVGGVFWGGILKRKYKDLRGVITTNKAGEFFYRKINNNTITIYNMMDDYCEALEQIKHEEKENIISVIARLDKEKNLIDFLDIIKMSKIPKSWKIKVMGEGSETKTLLNKRDAEEINVDFMGKGDINDVYNLLKKSKINCLTSIAEALPTILIQAMFHSNTLISYDCEHGPADIINEKNGFLVPVYNKEIFKQKLEYLTNNEDALNNLMTTSFRESKNWKKEKIVNKWTELLNH